MGEVELKVRQRLRHSGVLSVAWSPDGTRLVSAGHPYILWDPRTGEKLHELNEPWAAFVVNAPVRFTADGQHVVVVSDNAKIGDDWVGFGLWNVQTGQLDRQCPFPKGHFSRQTHGKPWFFPIPGKQRAIIAFNGDPGSPILVYDTTNWEVVGTPLIVPQGAATCFDVSPDGRLLAIGNMRPISFTGIPRGRIQFFDIETGALVRSIEGAHKDLTGHLAFSPDGRVIASAPPEGVRRTLNVVTNQMEDMSDADAVRVWDVSTGQKIVGFGDVYAGVSNLEFHPSGRWLGASVTGAVKDMAEFRLWDWQSQTTSAVVRHQSTSPQHIAFSPNGRLVAMAGTNKGWFAGGEIEIAEITSA